MSITMPYVFVDGNILFASQLNSNFGAAAEAYKASGDELTGTMDANGQTISDAGPILIGDTANAKNAKGLTINQGTTDDEIVSLKSADIAHGMTSLTETDTFGYSVKFAADSGGLSLVGLTEATRALALTGFGVTDDTTKSAAGNAYVEVYAGKKSGTSVGNPGANANLFAVRLTDGTTVLLTDTEGDLWIAGALSLGTTGSGIRDNSGVLEVQHGAGGWNGVITDPAWNAFRCVLSGGSITLERVKGTYVNIDGTLRKCTSLPTLAAPDIKVDIAGMTRAAACVVTWNGHGLSTGDSVTFSDITQTSWTALNGNTYSITWVSADTFSIPVNTSGYAGDYVPGTDPGKYRKRTFKYIYTYWNTTDIALEASDTGYTVDTATGRPQKTGDTTRRLVGMGLVLSDGTWSTGALCTLSYDHRREKVATSPMTADRSTASATYVELHTEMRVPFLAWTDDPVSIRASGAVQGSGAGEYHQTSIGIDGVTAEEIFQDDYTNSSLLRSFGFTLEKVCTVGCHYATLLGRTNSVTCTWQGSGTAGDRCSLAMTVRG